MNWKEEETQTSRITRESLQKRFIKEELMRYYFYLGRVKDIKAEIEEFKIEYEEELNNPVFGGSIIQMPNGISEKEHIVIRLNARLKDMEDNLKYYISKMDTLDAWLNYITPAQQKIIKVYVIQYQCQERSHAAAELKCSEELIMKQTNRAINRIYANFKEFS